MTTYSNPRAALNQYGQAGIAAAVMSASPHRLIQMLMEGALDKIAIAKGAVERKEFARKSQHISWASSIIQGLRKSLDGDAGGELAANLDALYDYMARRLMEANSRNDVGILDEVAGLLRQIKEAWDAIGPEVSQQENAASPQGEQVRISVGV